MAINYQIIAFLLLILSFTASFANTSQCCTSLFSFGDSATAAGIQTKDLAPGTESPHCAFPPYGETYFHKPTGRCSDGRNVVDFLAQHLGLPLLPPYHGGPIINPTSFLQGANLAVVSATTLDVEYLKSRGIVSCQNCSLDVQLARFKNLLASLCSTPSQCRDYLKNSLVLLGEIGGVDYMRAALQNLSSGSEVVDELMPLVVGRIGSAIEELIKLGVLHFLVPGDFPKGCFPVYLTQFQSTNQSDYDPVTGCMVYHNGVSSRHNRMLRDEIRRVQSLHRGVNIHYVDYYGPVIRMHEDPKKFGMERATINKACCGAGGPYNYDPSVVCGRAGAVACENPKRYVMWDDHHCTEAANRVIAAKVVRGQLSSLGCRGKQPAEEGLIAAE